MTFLSEAQPPGTFVATEAQEMERHLQVTETPLPARSELQEAIRLAQLANYGETSVQAAAQDLELSEWERLGVWEGGDVCGRAWLLKKGNRCALSFRGTANEADDWHRNTRTAPADFLESPGRACKAHTGFLTEYADLKGTNATAVSGSLTTSNGNLTVAAECGRDASEGLLVVGHSQGGALSNLFALEAVHKGWIPLDKLRVITFGEPVSTKDCTDPGLDKIRVVAAAPVRRMGLIVRPQEVDIVSAIGFPGGQHVGPTLFVFAGGVVSALPHSEGWTFGPLQTSSLVREFFRSPRGLLMHRMDTSYRPAIDALSQDTAYFSSQDLTSSEVHACRESGTGGWSSVDCSARTLDRCMRCVEDVDCASGACRRPGLRPFSLCGSEGGSVRGCPIAGRGRG
uniref:Fungal lipase-type domain-containing protein n=1 Tax=Chromera velia CCMP2878 TaxID=1169474 RepID=A0A0G4HBH5_9ALVE|eukprot:Cvel_25960.t1-p1 / transcript=Cvel_25960.t1 / gene=Cvel_25960 / organism=Chromera_velia_CCMP2878 / gene_product=hypothetical protein / transcript_product=hypothetical protein / location=Cvel_scaffold3011:26-2542(-) / protein_length=398 / sequence_SO=supercontig / SO=protein_coding / is_pseudo=false